MRYFCATLYISIDDQESFTFLYWGSIYASCIYYVWFVEEGRVYISQRLRNS